MLTQAISCFGFLSGVLSWYATYGTLHHLSPALTMHTLCCMPQSCSSASLSAPASSVLPQILLFQLPLLELFFRFLYRFLWQSRFLPGCCSCCFNLLFSFQAVNAGGGIAITRSQAWRCNWTTSGATLQVNQLQLFNIILHTAYYARMQYILTCSILPSECHGHYLSGLLLHVWFM